MSTILITGVSGFTGSHLVPLLLACGHTVHGVSNHADANPVPGLAGNHQVDISDAPACERLLDMVRPDVIIHLAAVSFVAHADISEMYRVNVLGTRALLDGSARMACPPSAILVASSANIYGNAAAGMLDESQPPAPANDYGVTKVATENLCRMYGEKLPIIITRPFNYIGVGQSENFLIPKIVAHVRCRAPVIELGNLDVSRDFTDVRVVVSAYRKLIEVPAAIGDTFNICSGRGTSLRDVIELASSIAGHEMEVQVNPAFVRPNEVKMLVGSPAHLQTVIGPIEYPTLEDTLRWMIEG